MPITDLIPWQKRDAEREEEGGAIQKPEDPFLTFEQRMNRMFDEFFQASGLEPVGAFREGWDAFSPRVDVVETDKEIKVSVELPGLEEKDIEVGLSQNVLTISGEKRQVKEEKGQNYLRAERSYGSFKRSIPLSCPVDAGKTEARFRKGVLTVTLPKAKREQARKRITIKAQ
jgi:HSP20 family protein